MTATLNDYYRRKDFLISYLGGKCVDCGTTSKLQFDHVIRAEKSFDISEKWSINITELLKEVDKCALRCEPCHNIKTREVDGIKAEHGKQSMYRHHGCRCDLCRRANRDVVREHRKRKRAKQSRDLFL